MTTTLRGVAASPGVGLAPAFVLATELPELPTATVADREAEAAQVAAALEEVAADLERRAAEIGGEAAEILTAQAAMAGDPELADGTAAAVRDEGTPGARAVVEIGETYAAALAASDNEYLAARAADVRDVCARVARRLLGVGDPDLASVTEPSIVVAADLAPADTARLDPALVRGLATIEGSRTSHTAILARALGVPAVVAVDGLLTAVTHGVTLGVDGDAGTVLVAPSEGDRAVLVDRVAAAEAARAARAAAPRAPGATADGHRVELAANVGVTAELTAAVERGAEAVGLYRTELTYLDRSEPPTEDEQAAQMAELAALLDGGRLVVRTFDFGADKPIRFIEQTVGPNPALGVRGIRLARRHPELLATQLRAVVRTAADAPVAVMAPMVATVEEADWFRAQVDAAHAAVGGDVAVEVGVMVEVPAAVLVADELAARLDFLSIGTNDLTQYLHAADRQEGALAALQDPFAPAVLRAVERVAAAGAANDAWVGVCGEAAGDPDWAVVAVGLGVSELSMGAAALDAVRETLAGRTLQECRDAAARALGAADATAARAAVAG